MKNMFQIIVLIALLFFSTHMLLAQWTQTALDSMYVHELVSSESYLFAGTAAGVFLSTNDGVSWTAVDSGVTNRNIQSFAIHGTNLYAGTYFGGVFLSTDLGTSWNPVNSGLTNLGVFALAVEADSGGTQGTRLFAGTGGGVFRSTNNGANWIQAGLADTVVHSLAVTSSGSGKLLAGTLYGVFISTDNGASWSHGNSAPFPMIDVQSLGVIPPDPSSSENLFAGTSGGIWRSIDSGMNWTVVDSGLPNPGGFLPDVPSIATIRRNAFAAIWGAGVYLSTDQATSWTQVSSGLTNMNVLSLVIGGSHLFAGTAGSGVWVRPLAEIITAVDAGAGTPPPRFDIDQNYPNPFNPSTTIIITLPKTTFVRLTVFSILGQEIATLVSQELSVGRHVVPWNAENMSSGIYFYRMQAGSFSQTKKLTLLR